MHPLLKRQCESAKTNDHIDVNTLISLVDQAYAEFDRMRTLREHAVELMSEEMYAINQDLAATAAKMRVAQERYDLVVKASRDGIWDWNLELDELWLSPRFKEIVGCTDDEDIKPDFLLSRAHPNDLEGLKSAIRMHLKRKTENFWYEFRVLYPRGNYVWLLARGCAVFDEDGKATRFAGSATDLTEQKIIQQRLAHDAVYDSLTSLPNRHLFLDRLQQEILRNTKFALFFLDIDRFKQINDMLGHEHGDQLLRAFTERLCAHIRDGDTFARLAGDEFAILMPKVTNKDAVVNFAHRIMDALVQPLIIAEQEVTITTSIGIAICRHGDPEQMVSGAALAMYRVKNRGGAQFEFFDDSMRAQSANRFNLERGLRRAISRCEMEVLYQPIVDLKNRRIAGFESLLRWNHPEMGVISPGEFIPLAEESHAINEIGQWVMEQSCQQLQAWHQQFEGLKPYVSVNVSASQLEYANFISGMRQALVKSGLPSEYLLLEMTESMLIGNLERVTPLFEQIRAEGVGIAIDDFGTGYSSLRYLSQLPFSTLKVDQSFVSRLLESEKDHNLTRLIIRLAKLLGLSVIAEGVELPKQIEMLVSLGADYGQGYLFAKPLNVDDATAFLQNAKDMFCWINNSQQSEAPQIDCL